MLIISINTYIFKNSHAIMKFLFDLNCETIQLRMQSDRRINVPAINSYLSRFWNMKQNMFWGLLFGCIQANTLICPRYFFLNKTEYSLLPFKQNYNQTVLGMARVGRRVEDSTMPWSFWLSKARFLLKLVLT